MIEITKIKNGLSWDNRNWGFSQELLPGGYEVIDDIHISVELDLHIICLKCDDTTIDGKGPFTDSQDLLTAIYGELP